MNKIRLLPGIAVLAISGCDVGYKDDGGAPIYVTWDEGQGLREWPIKGADAATFEVLGEDAFPRDASTFFFETHAIEGADPSTLHSFRSSVGTGQERRLSPILSQARL